MRETFIGAQSEKVIARGNVGTERPEFEGSPHGSLHDTALNDLT